MHIAIEGCAHGELETIYKCIEELQTENNINIDLLICCGDFQAVRNENDLRCMAVPPKYYNICSFYKYYSGELVAPVLTIFIGGNHEASNYLQELPFGGWVATNIYYMGYAGVVNFKGLRIGGISGIYKSNDYHKGHFESSPYTESTKRSVYHIRNVEVFRLKQLNGALDVFLSHDWPTEITRFGNEEQLLNFKPYFRDDISRGELGSPPCKELLFDLKPKYWFAAHLHCKFAALVPHDDGSSTKFLALDKCLPRKRFLQVVEIESSAGADRFEYDLEWLTVLKLTPHLFSTKHCTQYMPTKVFPERWNFTPTDEEKKCVLEQFSIDLTIPTTFKASAEVYKPACNNPNRYIFQPDLEINPQTTYFCKQLGIPDPTEELVQNNAGKNDNSSFGMHDSIAPNESRSFADNDEKEENLNVPVKRKSLVLPEVVNKSLEDIEDEADKKFEANRSQQASQADEVVATQCVEENEKVKPVTKVFKRRNASIYEQEQDS